MVDPKLGLCDTSGIDRYLGIINTWGISFAELQGRMTTSEQIRAARAMLRWEQKDLAAASQVSLPSIKRLEGIAGPLAAQERTIAALRSALESAGVIFVQENGDGPGVRLRKTGAAGHAHALELAEAVVDRNLAKVDAPPEAKARRKRIVTKLAKDLSTARKKPK